MTRRVGYTFEEIISKGVWELILDSWKKYNMCDLLLYKELLFKSQWLEWLKLEIKAIEVVDFHLINIQIYTIY